MDVDSIPAGEDFTSVIDREIAASDVVVAIIGRDWVGGTPSADGGASTIGGFVRLEVAGGALKVPRCSERARFSSMAPECRADGTSFAGGDVLQNAYRNAT
jgi:hypothetical protein